MILLHYIFIFSRNKNKYKRALYEKPVESRMCVCLILQGLLKATNIARIAPSIFQSTVRDERFNFSTRTS